MTLNSIGQSWAFSNLLLVIASESISVFLSLGFSLFVFFLPNSPFSPLPLPVLPVSTSLALPEAASSPRAALTTLQLVEPFVQLRHRFSWYTEALPLLLSFGRKRPKLVKASGFLQSTA